MPIKTTVTKEDILRGALSLLRRSGEEAVNARALAAEAGCSTQPIYRLFSGMGELLSELMPLAMEIYRGYVAQAATEGPPYRAYGMGYVRMARVDPHLFRYIFMKPHTPSAGGDNPDVLFGEGVGALRQGAPLSHTPAEGFHMEMWVFTHGLAVLQATGYYPMKDEEISRLFTVEYQSLLAYYQQKEKEGGAPDECH